MEKEKVRLRKVGRILSFLMFGFFLLALLRQKIFGICFFGGFFLLFSFKTCFFPLALIFWERLFLKVGAILGWVNSRLLLSILFFLVLTPLALILKLMKQSMLETEVDKKAKTYWLEYQTSKSTDPHKRQF